MKRALLALYAVVLMRVRRSPCWHSAPRRSDPMPMDPDKIQKGGRACLPGWKAWMDSGGTSTNG